MYNNALQEALQKLNNMGKATKPSSISEPKKINESKDSYMVTVRGGKYDDIVDVRYFENSKEAYLFTSGINYQMNKDYPNCYATMDSIPADDLYTSDFSRLFKNINSGNVLPSENIGSIVGPENREDYCKKVVDKINKFYHFKFVLDEFEHKNRNKENISKAIYVDSSNSRYWLTIGFNDSDNHVDFNCGIKGYEDFLENIAETMLDS